MFVFGEIIFDLGSFEYYFIAITPRFTLTQRAVAIKVSPTSQIDLFNNYSYAAICEKNIFKKQHHKKC